MFKIKGIVSALALLLICSFAITVNGQTMEPQKVDTITNEELKKVAVTLQEARTIQREANKKLREVVKETEIAFQRYQEIMRSKQNPQSDSVEVTEEEKEIISKIQPQLAEINRQSKQKFIEAIKENGLTRQRLQQVMLVIRTKPEVAQRFQKIAAEQNEMQQ